MNRIIDEFDGREVKPIRDKIYELLRKRIFNGNYKIGEKLVENDIATQMRVSRTPIREAFRKLETEGLVKHIPRKGIFVKGLDRQDIIEIYSIRSVLEGLAARSAAENISDKEIEKLKFLINNMQDALKKGEIEIFKSCCSSFNEVIRNASKMPRLNKMISQLKEYTEETREVTLADNERRQDVFHEHDAIFAAIINNNPEKAEEVTKSHIEKAKCIYLKATG